MHLTTLLFVLLALSTQVVLCFFRNINFSTPEQCGPFSINFSDPTTPPILPLSLTIVPILGNPITIQLPNDSWDSFSNTGEARVTFLPLSSGTQFVASLDDGTRASVGLVSDLLAVQTSNVTSCLAPKQRTGQRFYHIRGGLNQCSRFNVSFDPSTVGNPPSIRAFLPRSFSFPVNATDSPLRTVTLGQHGSGDEDDDGDEANKDANNGNDNNRGKNGGSKESNKEGGKVGNKEDGNGSSSGFLPPHNISTKEYLLNVIHGFQAILTLDDGEGHRESSGLFTAGGTSSSPSNCFRENFNIPSNGGSSLERGKSGGLSRAVKIVIAVLGASALIALAFFLFILFRRRRKARKDLEKTSFIFTEDVDMGSSFVSLATRIRTRISHLAYGKRSVRSYRSYRDEKDETSTWIPTSPIGSLAPHALWNAPSQPVEKHASWVTFASHTNLLKDGAKVPSAHNGQVVKVIDARNSLTFTNLGFNYPANLSSKVLSYQVEPDIPNPPVSRSSKSSRFILGSGYLSSRSSRGAPSPRNDAPPRPLSLPAFFAKSSIKRNSSGAKSSTDISSSGYITSRSSNAASEMTDNGIYISSPIRPTPDVPDGVSSVSDSGTIEKPAAAVMRDMHENSRGSIMWGVVRQEGKPNQRGRILPFPTVSLRASSSSSR